MLALSHGAGGPDCEVVCRMLVRVCVQAGCSRLVEAVSSSRPWALPTPEDGGAESSSCLAAWSCGQKPIVKVTIKAFSNQLAGSVLSFL